MGCHSSKAASHPAGPPTGTLLSSGDGPGKNPMAAQNAHATPELMTGADVQSEAMAVETPKAVGEDASEPAVIDPSQTYCVMPTSAQENETSKSSQDALRAEGVMAMACVEADAIPPILEENEKSQSTHEPTSRVHKNPQGWEEEGILFPHEGVRFLMQELSDAVNSMDPLPAWKWGNLSTWYHDYFYSVVHHHHDAEEQIYFPWIRARVSVPAKISADHPDLMQAMDDLSDMLKAGAAKPVDERAEHLADIQQVLRAFVDDMHQHLAEEEEIVPRLLREAGFTQEEEGAVVGQIIQGLGLDGNKKALPPMLHAYARWAGAEKAEAFVSAHLPLPIQFLYRNFWVHDFQHRHMGLLASLAEGVDTNPFASKWFC